MAQLFEMRKGVKIVSLQQKAKLHGSQTNSGPGVSKPKSKLDASDIVFNVYSYFKKEKEKGSLYISIDKLVKRTLAATGLRSKTTLNKVIFPRINQESSDNTTSSKPGMAMAIDTLSFRPKCRALDKFNQDVLRKVIFDMHNEKIMPTLGKILSRVEDSILISKSSLAVSLNEMGFSFRKRGNKHYVKENQQIIADRCFFLRNIREYRMAGFQVVYLDETWVKQNHKPNYGWFPKDECTLPQLPSGKGRRYVILHAGCKSKGLLPGCDLVFKAGSSDGDYHKEMNSKVFLEWWTHQLLPALDEPSVIVLDNASYHNTRLPETAPPKSNCRKQVMIDWLTERSINIPQNSKCSDLKALIKQNKPKPVYITDSLAGEQGHFVLRLPVRHCELNPIELVWANCKNFVARKNITSKVSEVKQLIADSFVRITPDVWTKCEDHVTKIEENYWKDDLIEESTIQPVIINFESDDPDSDF